MKIIEAKDPPYLNIEQTCNHCKSKFIVEDEDIDDVEVIENDGSIYFDTYYSFYINCPKCNVKVNLKPK